MKKCEKKYEMTELVEEDPEKSRLQETDDDITACCKVCCPHNKTKCRQTALHILLRIHAMWFYLAAFPSFVLAFSDNSCVAFQGTWHWLDFIGTQLLFALLIPALVHPDLLKLRNYVIYHFIAAGVNAMFQFSAFVIHTSILSTDTQLFGNYTQCLGRTVGGVWYTGVANLGGAVELTLQCIFAFQLIQLLVIRAGSPQTVGIHPHHPDLHE